MTHLYLIRHGDAETSGSNILEDPHLTELGIKQAEHLRDRLVGTGEINADVLIASTMLRARQTAEILAPAFNILPVLDSEVEEWRFPQDETLQVDEYIELFSHLPNDQKPFYQIIPGAESWAQFMLRACTSLNRITQAHRGKTIVIVCHGGIIDASFHFFFRLSSIHLSPAYFKTENTSITHWFQAWDESEEVASAWTLACYNDIMHLRDLHSTSRIPWSQITD